MKTLAISEWVAYAPIRAAEDELRELGVKLHDRAADRGEGLRDGTYDAVTLSNYHLVEALDSFGDDFGVSWAFAQPVGLGSDRIIVRNSIQTINDLYQARIGLCSSGLEFNLFEHIFFLAGLGPKRYINLHSRADYLPAFRDGRVDVVMAPQPERSRILKKFPEANIFDGDTELPRFGLYAVLVYRRTAWDSTLLNQVQDKIWGKATLLASYDSEQLKLAQPSSFQDIDFPADEVKTTIRWLSPDESHNYLCSNGVNSFKEHLRKIAEFRTLRLEAPPIELEQIEALVSDCERL